MEEHIHESIRLYELICDHYELLAGKSRTGSPQRMATDLNRLDELFEAAMASDERVMAALGRDRAVSRDLVARWRLCMEAARGKNQALSKRLAQKAMLLKEEIATAQEHRCVLQKYKSGLPRTSRKLNWKG